jgi:hypothetical protein
VPVRDGGGFPPYAATAHPTAALVMGLLIAAAVLGTAGIALAWLALRRGWAPNAGRLLAVGCLAAIAVTLVPHIGTADPESYAAYGRIAAQGGDPYDVAPDQLAARGDPYGALVEAPWQHTTSVYGPIATLEQQTAAGIAGDDARTTVWLLNLAGAFAFVLTALLLFRLARDDSGRRRVALLWAANPLLLWQLVAGGHLDTVEIAFVVGALATLNRRPLIAGALAGAAVAVKLPAALVAGGLAWSLRRAPRKLLQLGVGGVGVVVAAYITAGSHSLDQVRVASRLVSRATPWKPLASALDDAWGETASRRVISVLAALVAIGLAVALARGLPRRSDTVGGDALPSAVLAGSVLVVAWLLAAPYALPWYDGLAWALLVLLPLSRFDLVLLAHTAVLTLAYIPGRAVPLPSAVDDINTVLRSVVSPVVLGLLIAGLLFGHLRHTPPAGARKESVLV